MRLTTAVAACLLLAAPAGAQNGLTDAERATFYHLPEGSEVFPVDWLRAMTSVRTGKPFLDDLGRFGLIDDPKGEKFAPNDAHTLPVGLLKELGLAKV